MPFEEALVEFNDLLAINNRMSRKSVLNISPNLTELNAGSQRDRGKILIVMLKGSNQGGDSSYTY